MTREEAIDIIKCLAWHRRPDEEDVEQAIKALEQEPCEDAISREDRIKDLIGAIENDDCNYWTPTKIASALKQLPPIISNKGWEEMTVPCENCGHDMTFKIAVCGEPSRRKGYWEKFGKGWFCSLCSCVAPHEEFANCIQWEFSKYCPDCGAEMENQE